MAEQARQENRYERTRIERDNYEMFVRNKRTHRCSDLRVTHLGIELKWGSEHEARIAREDLYQSKRIIEHKIKC